MFPAEMVSGNVGWHCLLLTWPRGERDTGRDTYHRTAPPTCSSSRGRYPTISPFARGGRRARPCRRSGLLRRAAPTWVAAVRPVERQRCSPPCHRPRWHSGHINCQRLPAVSLGVLDIEDVSRCDGRDIRVRVGPFMSFSGRSLIAVACSLLSQTLARQRSIWTRPDRHRVGEARYTSPHRTGGATCSLNIVLLALRRVVRDGPEEQNWNGERDHGTRSTDL